MTNRTMQFYGQGFGATAVEISVTANGSQVFNGSVPTLDQPILPMRWPLNQPEILFSMEVPVEFQGTVPMEITVNSGRGILLHDVSINYVPLPNNVSSGAQGFEFNFHSGSIDNFSLNGDPISSPVCPPWKTSSESEGDWTTPVLVNSTLSFTIDINAGLL
jgi:hypothetical protein